MYKQYKIFYENNIKMITRMKILFFIFPIAQSFVLRTPTTMIHNTGSPPELWSFLSDNLKTSAREWFIRSAEKAGVPWKESVSSFDDQYTQMSLDMWKRRLEMPEIEYPNYFLQPFHGYDEGNMEWKAAIEGEAATLSVSSNYWKGADPYDAEEWMRYNVSKHIHEYCKRNHVYSNHISDVLDLGCSIGISTEFLRNTFRKADQIIGIDLSPFFVAMSAHRADKYGHDIKYIHANAEQIPLRNGSFDLITCNFLLHEVPYEPCMNIIKEAYRLLKPNGILAIVDLDPEYLKNQLTVNRFHRWAFEVTEPHIYEYYQHDMSIDLADSGFSDIEKMKNDPINSVWIGKKNIFSIQTLRVPSKLLSFAMA